jgi:hypothetical protein
MISLRIRRVAVLSLLLAAGLWTACGFSGLDGVSGGGIPDAAATAAETSTAVDADVREDASSADAASPDSGVVSRQHIVFVTSGTFTGDQVADQRCMEAMQGSILLMGSGRNFRAWLGTQDAGARERLTEYGPWFLLSDRGLVASDLGHLLPNLQHSINVDESGGFVAHQPIAWTGTDSTGLTVSTCSNWSTGDPAFVGQCGDVNASDAGWTASVTESCGASLRVYCFEQPGDAGP